VKLSTRDATLDDAQALAELRNAAAADLTARHGEGAWTGQVSEKGVLWGMKRNRVMVCLRGRTLAGTLSLGTIKPWAIDRSYFTKVKVPLYLTSMAVAPELQRQGVGRTMLDAACDWARERPADAIRLDAFEGPAGAGDFYAKCGFAEMGRATYRTAPLIYFEWLA
jgi:GNAT superfamily N-acetyltransferase